MHPLEIIFKESIFLLAATITTLTFKCYHVSNSKFFMTLTVSYQYPYFLIYLLFDRWLVGVSKINVEHFEKKEQKESFFLNLHGVLKLSSGYNFLQNITNETHLFL